MKYVIDIDNTICSQEEDYSKAQPFENVIEEINKLYDAGHTISLFTARGSETGIDWKQVTEQQLQQWGVQYHELRFGKPAADFYIDDKSKPIEELLDNKLWGKEEIIQATQKYVMKKLSINKGKSISLQKHESKEETMYISQGLGYAIVGNTARYVSEGDSIHIKPNTVHKIIALSKLEIIEASTSELDDIVRLAE